MKRFINYGSIEQFRNIVKDVKHRAMFKGVDENGDVIYDKDAIMPILKAEATEKIHGTNAAVCFSRPDGFWVQSRKNIITPEKDNMGCAFAAMANQDVWMEIIYNLADEYDIDLDKEIISIYFEWCGGSIQKNTCVSGLDKRAIIFKHFKVSPIEPQINNAGQEVAARWLETCLTTGPAIDKNGDKVDSVKVWLQDKHHKIFNVMTFPTVTIEINFGDVYDNDGNLIGSGVAIAQNKMVELTEEVEHNSGIAKTFGVPDNIGEGWVWTMLDDKGNLYKWKTKGEKHATSKVKKLKPVDEEKEKIKIQFANDVTPAWRLEQMWQEVFGINNEKQEPSMSLMGDFLRAVHKDIIKEESDKMYELGLEPKTVNSKISTIARRWFQEQLDKGVGF